MTPKELEVFLRKNGWSPTQAADELGYCRQSISAYLAGTRIIPLKLHKLCLKIENKQNTTPKK